MHFPNPEPHAKSACDMLARHMGFTVVPHPRGPQHAPNSYQRGAVRIWQVNPFRGQPWRCATIENGRYAHHKGVRRLPAFFIERGYYPLHVFSGAGRYATEERLVAALLNCQFYPGDLENLPAYVPPGEPVMPPVAAG